jgi:hypothetical protein
MSYGVDQVYVPTDAAKIGVLARAGSLATSSTTASNE